MKSAGFVVLALCALELSLMTLTRRYIAVSFLMFVPNMRIKSVVLY